MTLVISAQTRDSLWLVADRRLSWRDRPPVDDAVKIAFIESTDGQAIVSYAGSVGRTFCGHQPSAWIVSALRGRRCSLEVALDVLADAMQREFLRHLRQMEMRERQHSFAIPAFVDSEPRMYTIDLIERSTGVFFQYNRHILSGSLAPMQLTAPVGSIGTGRCALEKDRSYARILLDIVKAYNRGKVSASAVSAHLAKLCYFAHQRTTDGTVGPSCIVVWRNSKTSRHNRGGGQAFYETTKEVDGVVLPTVSVGMGIDVSAIANLMLEVCYPRVVEHFEAVKGGGDAHSPLEISREEFEERLSKLPHGPDEKLR
jgi:hypothetical protein